MKYIVKLINKNRPGTPLRARGVVLHETATPGATAEDEYQYFNKNDVKASAHAFVDNKEIIQTIPYDEVAWHAGPTANNNYIGIEMCRPKNFDKSYFDSVYWGSVNLVADILFDNLGIREVTKENVISHAEVSDKWGEVNHTDPIAYLREYGKTMDDFRRDTQNAISEKIDIEEQPAPEIAADHWAKKYLDDLIDKGYIDTPDAWQDFDSPATKAQVLALIDKVVNKL